MGTPLLPFDILTRLRKAFRTLRDGQRAQISALTSILSQQQVILQQLEAIRAFAESDRASKLASNTGAMLQTVAVDLLLASRSKDPRHIVQAATHLYSQNFEDSIIAEIFSRIGERSRYFVEIGIGTGVQCNSRGLLDRGWSGIWIEGNTNAARLAAERFNAYVSKGQLKVINSFVTRENISEIIQENIGTKVIDFLSLDIDYNTSHAWRKIVNRVRVACIEYNSSIPPTVEWEVDYAADKVWDGSNHFGASLKILERIGCDKQMSLVGCDLHGVNAFFVTAEECGEKFLAPFTAEVHFEPPRYRLIGERGHPPRQSFAPSATGAVDPIETGRVVDLPGIPNFLFHTHQDRTDIYISKQISQLGTWEPLETEIIQRLARHYRLFVDLGANIGWYSAVAKAVMPYGSHIIAFEPEAGNFALLQRNTASHTGVSIALEHAAVADLPGRLELYLSDSNQGDHRIYPSENGRKATEVHVVTLDEYLAGRTLEPLLLKCDTQGSEPKIVRGAKKTIATHLRLSTFVFEFWPYGIESSREDVDAFIAELSDWPHQAFIIDSAAGGLRLIRWAELAERCRGDIAPKTRRFVDILLVVPDTPMFASISDLILEGT